MFDTYQESNMAAGKPEMLWIQLKYNIYLLVLQLQIKFSTATSTFRLWQLRRANTDVVRHRNPKWRPKKPEVEVTDELFPLPVSWPTFWVPMSADVGHVGSVISESGMVENVEVAAGTASPALLSRVISISGL